MDFIGMVSLLYRVFVVAGLFAGCFPVARSVSSACFATSLASMGALFYVGESFVVLMEHAPFQDRGLDLRGAIYVHI